MKKLSIVGLLVATALLALGLELRSSASLARHVAAASRPVAGKPQGNLSDDGTQFVIRFASNPQAMPPFLLPDLNGHIVSTANVRGKVVVVNFWATWCPPCREEIPEMIELSKRYKDKLVIIGVSMDDAPADEVRDFARNNGIEYPIVMGSSTLSREYGGVPALPTSFVVNTDSRIVQKHEGVYPIDVYDSEIRSLLGMPVDAKVETFEDTGQIFLKNAIHAKELPGLDFKGLTEDQRRAVLKRVNSEKCTCGCQLTIAQCRINDSSCSTSLQLALKILHEIRAGSSRPGSSAPSTIRQ
ncbi:MAG TPA: TlpA disulfide reductase family protein [Verrucomicrobiae bacterium]|nr:TlpA disulfide reductase family protein [Verrucomicrobiae bacterium]